MAICDAHKEQCDNIRDVKERIDKLEIHHNYTKDMVEKLSKLPQEFYVFQSEMKTSLRLWGAFLTGVIAVVGIFVKITK